MPGWFARLLSQFAVDKIPTMLITPEQLDEVTSTLSKDRCAELAVPINERCTHYGITEKLPFRMFLANLLQESGEVNKLEEDMSYRAVTIVKTWRGRFPTIESATPYARNPVALANKVYGGRMGNTAPNDGWDYRGSGPIGITGKETMSKYAEYIGKPVLETAKLIRTDLKMAIDSACWFFAVYRKLIPVAKATPKEKGEKDNFKAVCRGINGGLIGYDVRLKYYNRINAVLG